MAHEIEFDTATGRSRMFAVEGISVWHGLGQRIASPPKDVDELLEVAGLDWTVEVRPTYRKKADGTFEEISDTSCTVRPQDDTYLGSGGVGFTPIQNRTLGEIAFAMSNDAEIKTAGSLRGGRQIWIMLKYPKEWMIAGQKHEANIFASNGHDWTRSLIIGGTDTDVVCANTLALAEGNTQNALRFSHTKNIADRVKFAVETIREMGTRFDDYYGRLGRLTTARMSSNERGGYFKAVAAARGGSEARRALFVDQLDERWRSGRGQDDRGQTVYRALSAVTDAVDHHVRPSYVNDATAARKERRFVDATFGGGAALKRHALNLALEHVAGPSGN